ncbi:MAG TPA: hypothetical protein VHF05_01520, partial [Candidatus Paceibacterota bacterium]|nr:hypothetical protein [Candidatus Paceibacterota bacterium]
MEFLKLVLLAFLGMAFAVGGVTSFSRPKQQRRRWYQKILRRIWESACMVGGFVLAISNGANLVYALEESGPFIHYGIPILLGILALGLLKKFLDIYHTYY